MGATRSTSRRTFLFTDIESSTRLWDQYPDAMLAALDQHDQLLIDAIDRGWVATSSVTPATVSSVCSAALRPAVEAALGAQRALLAADWEAIEPLRVRMGVHTGDVVLRGDEHHGWALNFTSRLHALAHGGQVVVSGAAMADVAASRSARASSSSTSGSITFATWPSRFACTPPCCDGVTARFDGLRRRRARRRRCRVRSRPSSAARRDVDRVIGEVGRHQVVTLAGIAGIGKTRLAVEVAASHGRRVSPTAWSMCELAAVAAEQVGAALAKALGVERRSLRTPEESVVEWLRDKQLLLVIDSCEDAPEAVRDLVHALVRDAPGCRVLATSHEPLMVEGEQVVRLSAARRRRFASRRCGAVPAAGAWRPVPTSSMTIAPVSSLGEVCRGGRRASPRHRDRRVECRVALVARHPRRRACGELPGCHARVSATARWSTRSTSRSVVSTLPPDLRSCGVRCSAARSIGRRSTRSPRPGSTAAELLAVLRTLVDRRSSPPRPGASAPVSDCSNRCVPMPERRVRTRRARGIAGGVPRPLRATSPRPPPTNCAGPTRPGGCRRSSSTSTTSVRPIGEASPIDGADASVRIVAALWDFAFMRMRSEIFDWGEAAAEAADRQHPLRAMVLGVVALGGWLHETPGEGDGVRRRVAAARARDRGDAVPCRLGWR